MCHVIESNSTLNFEHQLCHHGIIPLIKPLILFATFVKDSQQIMSPRGAVRLPNRFLSVSGQLLRFTDESNNLHCRLLIITGKQRKFIGDCGVYMGIVQNAIHLEND